MSAPKPGIVGWKFDLASPDSVAFTVHGAPVGQNSAYRRSRNGGMFMAREARAWKDGVAICARLAMQGRPPIEGPVSVTFRFHFPTRRNDIDSSLKGTLDALQKIVIRDDRQVVELVVTKHLDRLRPRAEIEVSPVLA